ncbi:MAG: hypothetical protein V7698_13990 [Paracoccaceae bacterium]
MEDISRCFVERNVALWASRIELPFEITTKVGLYEMTSHAEVEANFNQYLRACDVLGLDLIACNPVSLEQQPDGTWRGTYETRLVNGSQLATDPYMSTAVMMWDGSMFRMKAILGGRGHEDWTRR